MDVAKKIFIIEDSKMFALRLKSELENSFPDEKFEVFIFENGETCEGHLHLNPDLAIVDYHLDSKNQNAMNGLDLIDVMRKSCPETDFIMVTMDEQTELFLRSKEHDIYDYLIKNSNLSFTLNLSVSHWLKTKALHPS